MEVVWRREGFVEGLQGGLLERLVVPNRAATAMTQLLQCGTKRGRGPVNCGAGSGTSVSDVALRRLKHLVGSLERSDQGRK